MDYKTDFLLLYGPKLAKELPSIGASLRHIFITVLISAAILFAMEPLFGTRQGTPQVEQAVSAAVSGPNALACKNDRRCNKAPDRLRIIDFPIALDLKPSV